MTAVCLPFGDAVNPDHFQPAGRTGALLDLNGRSGEHGLLTRDTESS